MEKILSIEQRKEDFLLDEFWTSSIAAAFGRAKVYKENISEKDKIKFKKNLRNIVEEISKQYKVEVSPEAHIKNVREIQKLGSYILNFEFLNFGVSQKLLNLYLKYLWCLNKIPPPPHFPVDRVIQVKLGIKEVDIKPWTRMNGDDGEKEYNKVIENAIEKLKENNLNNIAEVELKLCKTAVFNNKD